LKECRARRRWSKRCASTKGNSSEQELDAAIGRIREQPDEETVVTLEWMCQKDVEQVAIMTEG